MTTSLVSFIVRKGNPKNIKTWDDLLKPGVEVLTPNPFTSGAAKWNLLAGYGAKSDGGKNPEAGLDYVRELITEHVKVQDKSGREALQTFTSGTGDVLLSYEYEATTARKKGEELDYVIPDDTIKIENPIAVTEEAAPAARRSSSTTCSPSRARRSSPTGATARSTTRSSQANKSKFPEPAEPLHDRRPRRLDEGQRRALRPREGLDRQDRGGGRGVDGLMSVALPLKRRRSGAGLPSGGLAMGVSMLWLSLIVLLPLAAVVARSLDGGARGVLGRRDVAPGGRRPALHAADLARDGGDQRRRRAR